MFKVLYEKRSIPIPVPMHLVPMALPELPPGSPAKRVILRVVVVLLFVVIGPVHREPVVLRDGIVGVLTSGAVDRTEYYAPAMMLALIPFANAKIY